MLLMLLKTIKDSDFMISQIMMIDLTGRWLRYNLFKELMVAEAYLSGVQPSNGV